MRLTRLCKCLASSLTQRVDQYSAFYPSPLSIQKILDFGRDGDSKASYLFLRKELLVRLANIMKEINLLPKELLTMPSVKQVKEWYHLSFEELLPYADLKDIGEKQLTAYSYNLSNILKRHSKVVETMAEGLIEMRESSGINVVNENSLQYFLDRFYMNRISIRMLINQHTLLYGNIPAEGPEHIGSIDPRCDVVEVIKDAYENARFLCDRFYLTSPGIKMETINNKPIVYVSSHIYHIMFEVIKNAMRAVVEFTGPDGDLPDLKVFVCHGKEDIAIKICDRGGGVPRSIGDQLFNYMYTTAPPPSRDGSEAPLAGFGFGLPLSRLYARYFQGDLILISMEGYGTDVTVYLKALSSEANELLPVYSTKSRRHYAQSVQTADWSQPVAHSRP